ncbi:DUF5696 domain-containing protein [Paenibacillus sp. GYB004]|uniref:DUF5696 domain-containing protein n=1 Tax=Paenibacillus sp. GYB004 TaxID=2994393 RepID=UPI002F967059
MLKRIARICFHTILIGTLLGAALSYDYKLTQEAKRAKAARDAGVKTEKETFLNSCTNTNDEGPIQMVGLDGRSSKEVKKVASNGSLAMYYDESKGMVYLESPATGKRWYTYPENQEGIASHQKPIVENPVTLRYTQGTSASPTYPYKEAGTLTPALIDGGVRVNYKLISLGISFAMEYKLTPDGFEVNVPFDSIVEENKCKVVSVEPLPYFGSGHPSENGFVFYPDGAGALMEFKKEHLEYYDQFYQSIYGGDEAFDSQTKSVVTKNPKEDIYSDPQERVALPVFGIKRGDQGFVGIVTEGEHDANIIAAPSGYQNVDIYRSSVEFTYRSSDSIFIGDSGEVPFFQGAMLEGERKVRYVLLEGDKSGYVGMAQAYRDHLMKDRGVKPVRQEQLPLRLHLVGGVVRDEIIGSTYIGMTTFAQAKETIDRFAAQGVNRLELVLEGWSDGGVYGKQPQHFPVAGKLGGDAGLTSLIEYAKSKQIPVYLDANYVKPFAPKGDYRASQDAIYGMKREVLTFYDPHPATLQVKRGTSYHMLNPGVAVNDYLKPELARYAELDVSGLRLNYMGEKLYSDLRVSSPLYRKQTIALWQEAMELTRKQLGSVAVTGGNAYTFGFADRIDGAPADSSHYTYEDATVPFYQIALHGLIPYSSEAGNLREDPKKSFLRMVEYGAVPKYQLTHENSSKLKRTPMDGLFSSEADTWLEPAAEEYRKAAEALNKVVDATITGHERVMQDVYRTTYSNGVTIVVNYGQLSRTVNGVTVSPGGFSVVQGGSGR